MRYNEKAASINEAAFLFYKALWGFERCNGDSSASGMFSDGYEQNGSPARVPDFRTFLR